MKKRFLKLSGIAVLISLTLVLTSCMGSGGIGSLFDFSKLFNNPIIQIALVLVIIWFYFSHKK